MDEEKKYEWSEGQRREIDNILNKYKKIKKYQKSNLYQIKKLNHE